jgi:hypothetical protein
MLDQGSRHGGGDELMDTYDGEFFITDNDASFFLRQASVAVQSLRMYLFISFAARCGLLRNISGRSAATNGGNHGSLAFHHSKDVEIMLCNAFLSS